jgi:STE24 endopeptidase
MNYIYTVDIKSWFFIAFMLFTLFGNSFGVIVDWLNTKKDGILDKLKSIHKISKASKTILTEEKVKTALEYKQTKDSFADMYGIISSGFTTMFMIWGIIPFTLACFMSAFPSMPFIWCWILTTFTFSIIGSFLNIPYSLYNTFVIEEKYGFNKTTKSLFAKDMIKSTIISILFGVPVTYGFDWLLKTFGSISVMDIVIIVASLIIVSKVFQWVIINLIMPLFNKFEPLKDGKLKTKLQKLCNKCNVKIDSIEVMDASKRSKHSNAFICGSFGKKKIVLFDTLFNNLTDDEIVAIVAHEIGHGKLYHLIYNGIIAIISLVITILVVFPLMKCIDFYHAFGYVWVTPENLSDNLIVGFTLGSMLYGSISWILEPIKSWISRKMEYAADNYAVKHTRNKKAMISSLIKLTAENLSDIFPHPVYEAVNYSHPSILNRIKAIKECNVNE